MSSPHFAPGSCRPREILAAVGQAYPQAWRQVDEFRAQRGKGLPEWPDWCFLPLHGAYAIVSGGGDARVPIERSHHTAIVGALAAWRVSQGIYRYDSTLYEAIRSTPIDGDLPCDPLYRLPEWCAYIETPGLVWTMGGEGRRIHGAWVHLDWSEGAPDELRLVLDTARTPAEALDEVQGCLPIPIILGEGSLAEAIERVFASGARQAAAHGVSFPAPPSDSAQQCAQALAPLLSLVLYLCAADAEIGDGAHPIKPEPKRTKRGWRLFPADAPRTWDVGVRIGAALRAAYHAQETGQTDIDPQTGKARPRPHVRRAHWHGFWTGPKLVPDMRRLALKWLPPIPVNITSADALPAVVRPVTGGD